MNRTFETGEPIEELQLGILTPLQKPGKKKGPPENIRPIIVLSVIRTVLTICMIKRIWDCISDAIPTEQATYQPGRGTTEHVFTVKMIAQKAITSNDYTAFLLLLDMSKAFDTVDWNCQMSTTSANCCQLIPRDRATVFPALGQLAELTHHSLKPLRLPYSSRLRLSLLLAGDVHSNPGPATQYPCAVCTSNVTSRGVSFKCNQCSGWVHSKCSGLKNAAQYRKTKDWACSSCNSPPAPSQPQAPPPPTPTTTMPISLSYNGTQTELATRSMNLVSSWRSTRSRWQ